MKSGPLHEMVEKEKLLKPNLGPLNSFESGTYTAFSSHTMLRSQQCKIEMFSPRGGSFWILETDVLQEVLCSYFGSDFLSRKHTP